jgi:hypothetical protein
MEEEQPSKWKSLLSGTQKVNWDMAKDSSNKWIGIGIIVGDDDECVIAAPRSTTNLVILEPVIKEDLVALHATKFSRDLGPRRIILEGDAIQVVNVKAKERNWSRYGQLVDNT